MIIVSDAGENRCIRCQGDGGQGWALNLKAVDEFGCQMLSTCGASAVAENKEFIAGCDTGSQHACRLDDIVHICFDASAFCFDAGFQNVEDDIFHCNRSRFRVQRSGLRTKKALKTRSPC